MSITPLPESNLSATQASPPPGASESKALGIPKSQFITVLALALGATFFFPWIPSLFGMLSGGDLAKAGSAGPLLWFWPVLSITTVVLASTGKDYKFAGQMAGATPFAVLAYAYAQFGSTDFVSRVQLGGWIALACGGALLAFSRR